ncbi:hypothetical protein QO200_03540 [Flavobacterium sp. Arc3]|uniref:hypothetical protein n=1 Tax=Flavobacterium sp. Arc3 TaxID=3046686 RepID=UPI00352EBCEA
MKKHMEIYGVLKFLSDNANLITSFTAIGALVISTIAIIKASQDNKKQIIVGKLEEIYELVCYLIVEYEELYELLLKLETCGAEDDDNYLEAIENYKLELKKVKKKIDLNELFNKIIRLHVLGNSYLSKELRLEILEYNFLFECLITTVQNCKLTRKNKDYNEGFPTTENIRSLASQLATKLIEKINLGDNRRSKRSDYKKYRDNVFKQKLKII